MRRTSLPGPPSSPRSSRSCSSCCAAGEEIKWNAPSFALSEHFVTFNAWAREDVQLIFHHGPRKSTSKGAPVDDPEGLLEWLATDRALMRFADMKDVRSRKASLQAIVRQWIKAMQSARKATSGVRKPAP